MATPTRASVVAPPPQPTSSPPRVPPLPPELERASRQSGQPPSHRNAVSSPPRRPPKEHAGADQPPYSTLSGQDTGWSPDPPPIGNWFRVGHTASQQPLNGIQQPPEAGPPLPQRLSSTQGAAQQYAQSREPAMGQHASYIQNPERPDSVFFAAPQAYSQTTGSRPHGRPPPPPLPPQYHEQRLSSPAGMSPPPGTYPPPAIPGSSAISRPDGLVTAGLLPPPTRALPPYPHAQTPAIQDLLSSPLSADSSSAPGGSTAAPPIAPNPEKDALLRALGAELHKRRVATAEQTRTEMMPALRAQHAAMVKASASLQQEIDELESLDATLSTNERILAESMGRADRVMDDARNEVLPAVDDLLVAPSVVGQQLYKTVAQERALDDTLFVLGKALDLGRIGLDVYLKVFILLVLDGDGKFYADARYPFSASPSSGLIQLSSLPVASNHHLANSNSTTTHMVISLFLPSPPPIRVIISFPPPPFLLSFFPNPMLLLPFSPIFPTANPQSRPRAFSQKGVGRED